MIKEYIAKIVASGSKEDMEKLSNMLDETIEYVKETSPEKYKKYKLELCGIANNYEFTEEYAKEIVDKMKPNAEVWDMSTTAQVRKQYGIDANDTDFYIVINSLANDYSSVIDTDQVEVYAKMAGAFINDKDAVKDKVWKYYTTIVEE